MDYDTDEEQDRDRMHSDNAFSTLTPPSVG